MKRRTANHTFETPSLVPLADMLTNTVGIMVFVLVFAVLTAGGTIIIRNLPFEKVTGKKQIVVICMHDRVLCTEYDDIYNYIYQKLGKPPSTKLNEWGHSFDHFNFDQQGMHVACHAHFSNYLGIVFLTKGTIDCTMLDNTGETTEQARTPNSVFHATLQRHSPQNSYLVFLVYSDSVDMYERTKAMAEQAGYETGWCPKGLGDSLQGAVYNADMHDLGFEIEPQS